MLFWSIFFPLIICLKIRKEDWLRGQLDVAPDSFTSCLSFARRALPTFRLVLESLRNETGVRDLFEVTNFDGKGILNLIDQYLPQ